MPSQKITKTLIDRLQAQENEYAVWDAKMPGFGVRVRPTGAKSFVVVYRAGAGGRGAPFRRYTIGATGKITADKARKRAKVILGSVAQGQDPVRDQKTARKLPSRAVDDVFAEFLASHRRKRDGKPIRETTRRETGRLLGLKPSAADLSSWEPRKPKTGALARWSGRDVRTITKRDVLNLLNATIERGAPVGANRLLAALKTFFRWCVKQDILAASPCEHVEDPSGEEACERPLTDLELVAVWRAAERVGDPYGGMVRLLLLTGQRRDEARCAVQSQFNMDARTWQIPDERTKNGREHLVPLSDAAVSVLKNLPKLKSAAGLLFSTNGAVPVSNLSRRKRRLDAEMLIEMRKIDPEVQFQEWRLHDLRHTLKTWMQKSRISKDVRNAVQNHYDGDMDELYGHYTFESEKRNALDEWARHINSLLTSTATK